MVGTTCTYNLSYSSITCIQGVYIVHVHSEYIIHAVLHVHKEYTSSYTDTCAGSRWQVEIELIIEVHRAQDIGMSYKINKEDNLNIYKLIIMK